MARSMCHISVFMMFMYVILGSAGKRDVEETPEEALFYTDHISPLLEKLYVSGKSKFCYFYFNFPPPPPPPIIFFQL